VPPARSAATWTTLVRLPPDVQSPVLLRDISVTQPELFTARYCILLPG
jgi:hypothetical protein